MKVIITGTTGYVGEGVMLACLDNPEIEKVRERGNIGIPCFVKEDGSVLISLKHYDESIIFIS